MQRILVTLGLLILMAGLAWPWLMRHGLGRLPGDIRVERDGFGFYFPLTTSIVVSLLVTLVFWLLRK
ncbi:MAG: DUF2905 domain-containing protein [Gammaproteobacteria bacterium]|nr:MAG: DUF2905 domain-containing protein [Gammaproteobacteria bacterium]